MAHPYQPFPLARLLEAVQQVPLSDYPPDERRLAQFGLPVRFRYAARPGRHSTSFQSLWLELLASWTVQPGCAVASWARACTWPVPGIMTLHLRSLGTTLSSIKTASRWVSLASASPQEEHCRGG